MVIFRITLTDIGKKCISSANDNVQPLMMLENNEDIKNEVEVEEELEAKEKWWNNRGTIESEL